MKTWTMSVVKSNEANAERCQFCGMDPDEALALLSERLKARGDIDSCQACLIVLSTAVKVAIHRRRGVS